MAEGNGVPRADRRRDRPTMTDVARIAGVSQSSVSLVLNNMTGSRISPGRSLRMRETASRTSSTACCVVSKR